jgi:membrane-bound lytic murein transglycosylase B
MSVTLRLGARMSAALVVVAVPVSMAGLSPAIVPTSKTVVPRAVASAQASIAPIAPSGTTLQRHYVRTLPAQRPQVVAEQTTLVGGLSLKTRKDRNRKIAVSSSKGSRVWTASSLAEHDLPSAALRAYKNAAGNIDAADPGCHLDWTLLAGIGRVESDHGRFGGSVLGNDGVPRPAIVGVPLNGKGPVAAIHDTDGGSFDGDKVWDRAVGPMQFIPSTWSGGAGRDGDGDGKKSPNDLDDASLAAAAYLCNGGGNLSDDTGVKSAIYRYNPSDYYVALVTAFARGYRTGVFVIPSPDLPPTADDAAKKQAGKAEARAARVKAAKARARAARAEARAAASKKAAARLAKARAAKAAAARAAAAAAARHKASSTPAKAPAPSRGDGGGGTPTPTPTPTPEAPKLDAVTGLLQGSGTDWTLDGHALDLGTGRMGDAAAHDYDGANGIQTVGEELAGLAGRNVTLQVKPGTWVVYLIAGKDYRNADGSFSTAG